MKTAISVPDEIFSEADAAAKRAGVSRSEFYVTAIRAYLERIREDAISERLNVFYEKIDERPDSFLGEAARQLLRRAAADE